MQYFLFGIVIAALLPVSANASSVLFCIGEHASSCPSDAQHYACGNTVQAVEASVCPSGTEPRRVSLTQHSGNKCGYNIVKVACDATTNAPTAPEQPTHAAISVTVDQTMAAKTPIQHVAECRTSAPCMAVLSAISEVTQIPVDKAVAAIASISKSQKSGSETADFRFTLPAGYRYCASSMTMTSIIPFDGDKGSLFSSRALPNGVSAQTWTPVRNDGGRSWVEATIDVVGIRYDLAEAAYSSGRCLAPGSGEGRLLYYCRGGGCVSTKDRGQSVSTNTPPAKSANN